MKFDITLQEQTVSVELPDDAVKSYGEYYFPLTKETIDVFVKSINLRQSHPEVFAKENDETFLKADVLQSVLQAELQHSIDIREDLTISSV